MLLSPVLRPSVSKSHQDVDGSTLAVPYRAHRQLAGRLSALKEDGFTIAALTPRPAAVESQVRATGTRRAPGWQRRAGTDGRRCANVDLRVRIPTTAQVDSLNLATATSIALCHFANPQG